MKRRSRLLVIILVILGIGAALLVVAALILPGLVDVNRYRPTIEAKVEEMLGRDVRLGQMRLTVLPLLAIKVQDLGIAALPAEGEGDLLTAKSLRLGVRLGPLLSKRIEVSSVVIEQPTAVLVRSEDGSWNVQKLLRERPQEEPSALREESPEPEEELPATDEPASAPAFSVDVLRLSDGRITLRDASVLLGRTLEATLTEVDLSLSDLALDRTVGVTLSTGLAEMPGARLKLSGRAGPLDRPEGTPLHVEGELKIDRLDPAAVGEWIEALAGFAPPEGRIDLDGSARLDLPGSFNLEVDSLAAALGSSRLKLKGSIASDEDALDIDLDLASLEMEPAEVRRLLSDAGVEWPLPEGVLGDRPLSGSGRIQADFGKSDDGWKAKRIVVDGLKLDGLYGSGKASASGTVGPIDTAGKLPTDISLELENAPLRDAATYLGPYLPVKARSGTLDLEGRISGSVPDRFDASGTLNLARAEVLLESPDGAPREIPLDLSLVYDIGVRNSADVLEFRTLEAKLGRNTLRLRGKVDRTGPQPRLDLTVLPTEFGADDLAGVLALAGYDPPVSFSSGRPIGLEGRVRGSPGTEGGLEVEGKARLADFTFSHPSMAAPMEKVGGTLEIKGQRVQVKDFSGVIGDSDIAGDLTLTGFQSPRIEFRLHSKQAAFGELFSFMRTPEEPEPGAGQSQPGAEQPVAAQSGQDVSVVQDITGQGTLRIDRGSFGTLDFTQLDADVGLDGQVLALERLEMDLYEGHFSGAATMDLAEEPPAFQVQSKIKDLDIDAILTDNLELPGLLTGSFSGDLEGSGAGAGVESIIRSLAGSGSIKVGSGRIGELDFLEMLSQVTGIFGERTLHRLSRKLETEGTEFTELAGDILIEGPWLRSANLRLESRDLIIEGKVGINLLQAGLNGNLQVIFSSEISQLMRDERSRAARLFWDGRRDRVTLPLSVSGPFAAPEPDIDWDAATGQLVERTLDRQIEDIVGGLLGGKKPEPLPEPPPPPPDSDLSRKSSELAAESGQPEAARPDELAVEFTRVRWSSSLLAPDLKVEGTIRGRNIARAANVVKDAKGRTLRRIEEMWAVKSYIEEAADRSKPAEISFNFKVHGEKFLIAKGPFTVTVTVFDTQGRSARASVEIDN